MNEKIYRVLDQYRVGSRYTDEVGKHYHFGKKHLKLLSQPNIWFLYHEPKSNGKGEYFGCGQIGPVTPDPKRDQKYFADIINYRPFVRMVADLDGNKAPREKGPFYNPQNAVRQIEADLYSLICEEGGLVQVSEVQGSLPPAVIARPSVPIVDAMSCKYWTLSAGTGGEFWQQFRESGIAAIGWDDARDLSQFIDKETIRRRLQELYPSDSSRRNDAHACWQFVHEIEVGDIIFAKQGLSRILGYGIVEGNYQFDETRSHFKNTRKVKWISTGAWELPPPSKMALKTLTNVTSYHGFVAVVLKTIGLGNGEVIPGPDRPSVESLNLRRGSVQEVVDGGESQEQSDIEYFDISKAMKGLFLGFQQFDEILTALKEKKNIIIQGAPGVGKTYIAKRIAYALIGSNDPKRIATIQFHQSYSYEDFIQGFRPNTKGQFDLKNGIFYQFCSRAQREESNSTPFVLIIDEINRGNLSKIFGELMMLVEPDKRGKEHAISLAYAEGLDDKFYIPSNLHVIGTMNTADRSLALVDFALRRRFRFLTLRPEFGSSKFTEFLKEVGVGDDLAKKIVKRMMDLNDDIKADSKNLGPGYQIGHSFFCPQREVVPDLAWYRRVIEAEIMPLIEEYWFDNEQKVKDHRLTLLA